MASSSTQANEGHDRPSQCNEDTDWVVVKAGADIGTEDFEIIESAEAQCWCGGSDAELCRQKGHRWPLCQVDREELLPKQPDEPSHRSHDKEDKDARADSNSDVDQPPGEDWTTGPSKSDPSPRPKKKRRIAIPPVSANTSSGPFSQLAVLTDLMDQTRSDYEDLYSAYQK
ncbi:hypothetical protein KVR01_007845 [Diaporthe batatas]|uniref:uncharacterized protein n=1 Tax=Diaporthe batatas TaxID=748121 RepID=UPI001D043144|nr:uncharacterized protein KVR01_007845 [Diaporthe batatas]KAG8162080.1 hypothetical protein KVR01_007845 [Diaporthe batatas]